MEYNEAEEAVTEPQNEDAEELAKAAEAFFTEIEEVSKLGLEGSTWEEDEFLQRVSSKKDLSPTIKQTHHARLRMTARRYIAAHLMQVGRPGSDEIRHEKLKISKHAEAPGLPGYDFNNPIEVINLEDEEIPRLKAFLDQYPTLAAPGDHVIIPAEKGADDIVKGLTEIIGEKEFTQSHIVNLLKAMVTKKDLLAALASEEFTDIQRPLAAAIQAGQRERALEILEQGIAEGNPEQFFQKLFETNWWMFGNRYVGAFDRTHYTSDEIVDIPLLRADGYAEIVELKKPDAGIFVKDANRWIVSADVNKAVNQAGRYITEVERQRDTISAKYGVDFFKVGAKIVIGSLSLEDEDYEEKRNALRAYNSHLHRIEVLTYSEIVKRSRTLIDLDLETAKVEAHPKKKDK